MIIYKATNLINGKIYIGQTKQNFDRRKSQHISNSFNIKSQDYDSAFHRAIRKYGCNNFKWEVIDFAENKTILIEKEIKWIKYYRSYTGFKDSHGYNMTLGGEGLVGGGYLQEGELNHQTRIKDRDIKNIKLLSRDTSLTYHQIGKIFNSTAKYIAEIVNGRKRKKIKINDEDKVSIEYQYLLKKYPKKSKNKQCNKKKKTNNKHNSKRVNKEEFSKRVSAGIFGHYTNNHKFVIETLIIKALVKEYPLKQLSEYFSIKESAISRIENGIRREQICMENVNDYLKDIAIHFIELYKDKNKPKHKRLKRLKKPKNNI